MMLTRQSLCGLSDGVDAYGNPQRGDATQVQCADILYGSQVTPGGIVRQRINQCWSGNLLLMGAPNGYNLIPMTGEQASYILDPANHAPGTEASKTVFVSPVEDLSALNLNTQNQAYVQQQLNAPPPPSPTPAVVSAAPPMPSTLVRPSTPAPTLLSAPQIQLAPSRTSPPVLAPSIERPVEIVEAPAPDRVSGEPDGSGSLFDNSTLMLGAAAVVAAIFLFKGR
jgi:hypothetical protein